MEENSRTRERDKKEMSNTDWINQMKSEREESETTRANQNLHVKEVKSTRTEHKCHFCKHLVEVGSPAKVVTEEINNTFINKVIYKIYYYHPICFVQNYPNYRPKRNNDKMIER